tara:strand:+ start:2697 stop:3218 length:522 start_codon:yes stop_codon:yes gene_type:complete
MKVTKAQLKQIINEELENVMKEDVLDYIEKGDTVLIPVGNILLKPDGRVIFSANDREQQSVGDIIAQVDKETVQRLQGGGTLETPKELTGIAKDMMDRLEPMKAAYESNEHGVPPALEEIDSLIRAGDWEELGGTIRNHWNALLKWHQRNGTKLNHDVTTGFNTINTLVRKVG